MGSIKGREQGGNGPNPQPLTDADIYTIVREGILKSGRKPDMSKERVQRVIDAYLAEEAAKSKAEKQPD